MSGHGQKQVDDALLQALACGASAESAAQKVGVSSSTVYRRLKKPEIQRRLKALKREWVQRTAAALSAAALESVKTLVALQRESSPPSVRLGAARAVLEIGIDLRESADFEARITFLEQHFDNGSVTEREIA